MTDEEKLADLLARLANGELGLEAMISALQETLKSKANATNNGAPSLTTSAGLGNPYSEMTDLQIVDHLYKTNPNLFKNIQTSNVGSETIDKDPALELTIAQKRMMGGTQGGTFGKPTYAKFESALGAAVNDDGYMSRREKRLIGRDLGINKHIMNRIRKSFNNGETNGAFNNYVRGLQKRSYIKDGKIYTEGKDGWDENIYNNDPNIKYKGTDLNSLVNSYNNDVLEARKNANIVYKDGRYLADGIDVTDAAWLKNDTDRLKKILQLTYLDAVNGFSDLDFLDKYSYDNLLGTLGFNASEYNDDVYNSLNDEDKIAYRLDITEQLLEHLDDLRASLDGTFNFDGNVKADAIMRSLINNQSSRPDWLGRIQWSNNNVYNNALKTRRNLGAFGLLAKNGAVMNYIQKHLLGKTLVQKEEPAWYNWEYFDHQNEDLFGNNYAVKKVDRDGNVGSYHKYSTPTAGVYLYLPELGGRAYFADDKDNLGIYAGNVGAGGWTDHDIWNLYSNYATKYGSLGLDYEDISVNPAKANESSASKQDDTAPVNKPNDKHDATPANKPDNTPAYKPYKRKRTERYHSNSAYATYKNGGLLNMKNINYFLEGGAVAPAQAAPAEGAQDMQAQVMQLVQAAMSGDELATQTIQQIMQAAQQGDQQAAQLAQMIQEIAQQMQGQAQAAKRGAKLSYIKSLRSGCPEGYEVSYHKEGGRVCKECVAKAALGEKITNAFTTGVNAISPGEALVNPKNQKAASRKLFGVVGDAVNPASMVRETGNVVRNGVSAIKDAYGKVLDPNVSTPEKLKMLTVPPAGGLVSDAVRRLRGVDQPAELPVTPALSTLHKKGGSLKKTLKCGGETKKNK